MLRYLALCFQKDHGQNAFNVIVSKYSLDTLQKLPDGSKGYKITEEQIRHIYQSEQPRLSIQDKIEIIVQRAYQIYKGLGVIDELRDQNIDGVNGGTSGMPPDVVQTTDFLEYTKQQHFIPQSYDAVWTFYRGKSLHLEFLSFGSEKELKRVCQNIYGFGNPGQLNESKGYIINDMADGSRVVVVRPKMAESWAFLSANLTIHSWNWISKSKIKGHSLRLICLFFSSWAIRSLLSLADRARGKQRCLRH